LTAVGGVAAIDLEREKKGEVLFAGIFSETLFTLRAALPALASWDSSCCIKHLVM